MLTGLFGQTRLPFTMLTLLILMGLLIVYAVLVSVMEIKPIAERQKSARVAGGVFVLALAVIFLEVHAALLELAFEFAEADYRSRPRGSGRRTRFLTRCSITAKPLCFMSAR